MGSIELLGLKGKKKGSEGFHCMLGVGCSMFIGFIVFIELLGLVRHERISLLSVCNCTKDEGRPLGTGLQGQVSNHLKLLW